MTHPMDMKRDFYLTAAEAVAYGLIDTVIKPEQPVKMMRYHPLTYLYTLLNITTHPN